MISGEIMELHHSKHHAAYVTNLNKALEAYADAEAKHDLQKMIALQSAINFNGGGALCRVGAGRVWCACLVGADAQRAAASWRCPLVLASCFVGENSWCLLRGGCMCDVCAFGCRSNLSPASSRTLAGASCSPITFQATSTTTFSGPTWRLKRCDGVLCVTHVCRGRLGVLCCS